MIPWHLKYRHSLGFAILCALLGIPFLLRTIAPTLEPYPAIILPAGAGKVSRSEGIFTFNRFEAIGIDAATGKEKQLNPSTLLRPIPVQYFHVIFDNNFGLGASPTRRIRFKYLRFPTINLKRRAANEVERSQAIKWIGDRLASEGCDPKKLILRRNRIGFDEAKRAATEPYSTNETVFRFD